MAATCASGLVEVALGDGAARERELDEPRALAVLREVLDGEALEQRAHVRLDALHAEEQLVADLLVGRRRGPLRAAAVRPAQRDEDAPLCRAQRGCRATADAARLPQLATGRAEADRGGAEVQDVAPAQPQSPGDALAVDERAVARQA